MKNKKKIFDYLWEETNIRNYVSYYDLIYLNNYQFDKIELLIKKVLPNNLVDYTFRLFDNREYYQVHLKVDRIKNLILEAEGYREHFLASVLTYYDEIFNLLPLDDPAEVGNLLINKYANNNKVKIKKEAQVDLVLEFSENNYYNSYNFTPNLYVGEKKLYKVGNKYQNFINTYLEQEGSLKFGKEFTYDPEEYYFSKDSEHIINAVIDYNNSNNSYYRNVNKIKRFLKNLENSKFTLNNYKIDGIKKGLSVETKLTKDNDKYKISFDLENVKLIIQGDYQYIMYKGELFELNKKEQSLLEDIYDLEIKEMEFPKDKLESFSSGLLNLIKNNIVVADDIDEIRVAKKIQCELYFDLRNKDINCNPKFKYDQIEIDYFDNKSNVVRDTEYEAEVINDLQHYGFILDKKKIYIDDLEKMVDFIENGLEELAQKYVVYTTEKFKNVNIKKKTNITSTFGIGQDNILSYDFDLGDISNDEIVNIFKEIKNKNKYYRLKNGDILNLEDENLQELENLSEDLELTDEEIINGKGSLLKYRAIYLDSLKNTKYKIINTDNLFDNFIDNFYKYKDSELTLSNNELSVLRDYQVTGVKWLYNLAKTGFGGILADEMGLGKTIQVIYYIKQILKDDISKKILIVVPTSLAYNWEKEFNSFASDIKKLICVGKKEIREEMIKNINDNNVYITTYGLLREDYDLYKDMVFDTFIIDEAQNIKNSLAGITKCVKSINANTKFALTGTPLENSVLELWSIFDFIMPGYLASLTKFQSKYRIKDYNEETDKLIKGLSSQINPFILRRKKSDVVKELPEKLINDIYIDLDEKQKILYAAELEKVKKLLEEAMENGGMAKVRFVMLTLLTKLRQLCIDPSLVYENYDGKSNKIDTLVNVVDEYTKNDHKILIFSSFKKGLNIVKKNLEKNKINCYMIDGSVSSKNRMSMVENFNNNDDVKVFLIMLKSGGTGLNLTSADVVLHLDLWWNPQAENQATDRAHRIGQTKNVEVIHLIMKGTIEEKILDLQNKKRILSDKLIDGEVRDKNILSELTEEDIKNLLAYENKE